MALLDKLFSAGVQLLPSSGRLFQKGYGDLEKLQAFNSEVTEVHLKPGRQPFIPQVQWDDAGVRSGGVLTRDGHFESPAHKYLSPESRSVHFQYVAPLVEQPPPPLAEQSPHRLAIQLPGTGDQWYWYRNSIAKQLAKKGVASILLTFPLYGARRPKHQTMHIVQTVSEFAIAAIAASLEAMAVCAWARETFPGVRCVITGVSMGGALASSAAIMAGAPIACCPFVAPASAQALITGVLHKRIDWPSLKAGTNRSQQEEEQQLESALSMMCVENITSRMTGTPELNSLVQVMAKADELVSPEQCEELHRLLSGLTSPKRASKLITVEGGHLWACSSMCDSVYVPAIMESLDMLEWSP